MANLFRSSIHGVHCFHVCLCLGMYLSIHEADYLGVFENWSLDIFPKPLYIHWSWLSVIVITELWLKLKAVPNIIPAHRASVNTVYSFIHFKPVVQSKQVWCTKSTGDNSLIRLKS